MGYHDRYTGRESEPTRVRDRCDTKQKILIHVFTQAQNLSARQSAKLLAHSATQHNPFFKDDDYRSLELEKFSLSEGAEPKSWFS